MAWCVLPKPGWVRRISTQRVAETVIDQQGYWSLSGVGKSPVLGAGEEELVADVGGWLHAWAEIKQADVLKRMEARFLTVGEEGYKYRNVEKWDLSCGVALELEIAAWTHGFQYTSMGIKIDIDVNVCKQTCIFAHTSLALSIERAWKQWHPNSNKHISWFINTILHLKEPGFLSEMDDPEIGVGEVQDELGTCVVSEAKSSKNDGDMSKDHRSQLGGALTGQIWNYSASK